MSVSSLPTTGIHLDLVFLVDRIGDETTVAGRCEFALGVIDGLLARMGVQDLLCIGVIAYDERDPMNRPHLRNHQPVEWQVLSDYMKAAQSLASIAAVDPAELDFEAAVAEALDLLAGPEWDWHSGSKRLLITVGSRPPHPPRGKQRPQQMPDIANRDWRRLLAKLHSTLDIRTMALLCPIYWSASQALLPGYTWPYLTYCWATLGRDGLFEAETTSPEDLCQVIFRTLLEARQNRS